MIVPTISELSFERDDRVADGLRAQLVLDRLELMFELFLACPSASASSEQLLTHSFQ
mgnify:CR=1 FL=1